MARREMPSQDYLRQCFDYDATTGVLIWKNRPESHFRNAKAYQTFRGQFVGKVAGRHTVKCPYVQVKLNKTPYYAHRLIWVLVHGIEPDEIDHINGDTMNNALSNLRAADHLTNMHNLSRPRNNTSGFVGVRLRKGRFEAVIGIAGKDRLLGRFDTVEAALKTRRAAQEFYGYHPNHGR